MEDEDRDSIKTIRDQLIRAGTYEGLSFRYVRDRESRKVYVGIIREIKRNQYVCTEVKPEVLSR